MIKILLISLWYLLPAALANHNASCGDRVFVPSFFKPFLSKLAVPIDFGFKSDGKEIFGKNKTWRGLVVGILTGIFVAGVQALLFYNVDFFRRNTIIDYRTINFVLIGILMGGGALVGDLVESFIKRKMNKPSGKPWFPFDQIDWILGAILFSSLIYVPSFKIAVVTVILYILVHLCSDRVVCMMGIKKREEVN